MGLQRAIKDYYTNRKIRNINRKIVSDAIDNKNPELVVKNGLLRGCVIPVNVQQEVHYSQNY